ncbi:hypothetical protein BU26DRAFT_61872 [Trematosphaeria pertusa]|uniref:Uncharacterized protein n=1 Tax=Trematosphaeria pertusa TaxID=390896 RepID=A0A6A6I6X0_9PLEO|nr:uncharacterized protein BU26DRAFT_61872 [Trematosphaeria pertusa]KAF2246111.1 hypothetical protein BU26DRAFT_61872 [Trematosphaeria pertusa]
MAKRKARTSIAPQPMPKKSRVDVALNNVESKPPQAYAGFLNYDIRVMIYEYMDLMPLAGGEEWKGLLLSCKDASEEMNEVAAKRLKKFLALFPEKYKAGLPKRLAANYTMEISVVPLLPEWNALTAVTILLPPAALGRERFEHLHPLLSLYLDKLTVLSKSDIATARKSLRSYVFPEFENIYSSMTAITNRSMPWLRYVADALMKLYLNILHHSDEKFRLYVGRTCQLRPIRVKTVVIAWDFRGDKAKELEERARGRRRLMQGRKYEYAENTKNKARSHYKLGRDYEFSYRYDLMGMGGLMGEAGIVSKSRWAHNEPYHPLQLLQTVKTKPISSDGIGQEWVEG